MITILIPTYNRPGYLERILNYYGDCGIAYNVIVTDSSSTDNKEINKKVVSSLSRVNVSYISHPPEINPYFKLVDALNHANTKYCVICPEDDFIIPNSINQSVDFLEKNPDFAIAHGRYISFWLERRKNGQYFRWQPTYSPLSIAFEHPDQRLTYHLSNYCTPTFYAVHRTALLRLIFTETLKANLDTLLFSELLVSMLAVIYGKTKHLDVLYAARDVDSIRSVHWPSLADLIGSGTYDIEYDKFRDCLAIHLNNNSQLDLLNAKKVVDEAMSVYMNKYYYPSKSKMGYISARMGRILGYLNLPDWLDRGIRRSYKRLAESRSTRKASIDMSPSSKYYDDFNRIRQHVFSSSGIIAK
jgi:glycosyltransferase domain-containing protein